MRIIIFLLLACRLLATDFDVVVVGTSPICLLEALYQHYSGKRVLILEQADHCGGAWKSIDICGVPHADLGCHLMGKDPEMYNFLQQYVGCNLVCMENPQKPFDPSHNSEGFYPAQGCYELIHNLTHLIASTSIVMLLGHHLDEIQIVDNTATITTQDKHFTTNKIIVTPFSDIGENVNKNTYYHLYLLISDPTPPRFTYRSGIDRGVSRIMNLTHFVGLEQSQLIVLQLHKSPDLSTCDTYLDALKKHNLIDPTSTLLQADTYLYEQTNASTKFQNSPIFEVLQTNPIQQMKNYIPKWEKVLPLFAMHD